MRRERFLEEVAQRLSRPRLRSAPPRSASNVSWPPVEGGLLTRFESELNNVGATMSRATSRADVVSQLVTAVAESEEKPTVAVARAEFEAFGLDTTASPFDRVICWGDTCCRTADRFRQLALRADLGITTAVSAVAMSGTLVLAASQRSPRSTSLLPRRHLALIQESQLVPDLCAALTQGRFSHAATAQPSNIICITGPSRTSDIENDLSIGVHGPAEVHVIVCSGAMA